MRPLPIAVLAAADRAEADRLAARLEARRAHAWRTLPRGAVVFAYPPSGAAAALRDVALGCTLAGVAAVVLVSDGPPAPLPWWGVRFHRILCRSQEEASAWRRAGVALGRLVVIEDGPDADVRAALRALVAEVASMAGR